MRRSLSNGVHAMLPRRLLSLIFLDYAGTNGPLCLSKCAIESGVPLSCSIGDEYEGHMPRSGITAGYRDAPNLPDWS